MSLAMVVLFLPVATAGCFGSFRLTRKVYGFNQSVSSDKWVRWLAFLVMVIVPVYELGMLVDALFANSIEFWSGRNPIADAGTTRVVRGPGGETLTMTLQADGSIAATVLKANGMLDTFTLVRDLGAVVAFDAQGHEIARVGDGVAGEPMLLAAR